MLVMSWRSGQETAYRLRNVVYDHSAVGVSIVHGRKRLVPLLASRIPDLELDGRVLVEGDGLREESGADGGFSERVELILRSVSSEGLTKLMVYGWSSP